MHMTDDLFIFVYGSHFCCANGGFVMSTFFAVEHGIRHGRMSVVTTTLPFYLLRITH